MIIIKTTSNSALVTNNIVKYLLINKYVSCVNIIKNNTSNYIWKEKIIKDKENILLIKTIKENEKVVYNSIKALHDYETPEISTLKVTNFDNKYYNWMRSNIKIVNAT